MSKETITAADVGKLTVNSEKSEEKAKAEAQATAHRARQVASLQAEIESEQESLKLLDARAKTVKDAIARAQKKLDDLKASA